MGTRVHTLDMSLAIQIFLYAGIIIQLFRPVDPAINYPNHITGFGVIRERIWRAFKFVIGWVIVIFILAFFGVDINS
jgi:hypothetical protein